MVQLSMYDTGIMKWVKIFIYEVQSTIIRCLKSYQTITMVNHKQQTDTSTSDTVLETLITIDLLFV